MLRGLPAFHPVGSRGAQAAADRAAAQSSEDAATAHRARAMFLEKAPDRTRKEKAAAVKAAKAQAAKSANVAGAAKQAADPSPATHLIFDTSEE